MRQTHVGGDKLFVDYACDTMPVIIDRLWAWCAAPLCRAGKQPCAATLADNGSGSLPHEVADTVRSPFRRYPKSYLEGGWVLA